MTSSLTKLNRKMQGITSTNVRRYLVKHFLEYHFTSGKPLDYHRLVDECKPEDNKYCNRGRADCICLVKFKEFNWCIPV